MSPLRLGYKTVRESCPLTRLLSNLALVMRTPTAEVIRRFAVVTMFMEKLEVGDGMRTPLRLGDHVIDL